MILRMQVLSLIKKSIKISGLKIESDQLGGNVICVPISALENVNINKLENKIVDLAEQRLNLMEDHSKNAQCIVIESDIVHFGQTKF